MNEKIKELSLKIRKEGYEKGQAEARQLLENAKKEAEDMHKNAIMEAKAIVKRAREDADRYREGVIADLKLSADRIMQLLRKDIGDLLLTKVIDEPLDKSMNDSNFVAKLIEDAVRNWKAYDREADLEILLPPGAYPTVVAQLSRNGHSWLSNGIDLKEVSGIGAGFEIQPNNGHFKISMTDEAFRLFLKENLRPVAHKFLFEGE